MDSNLLSIQTPKTVHAMYKNLFRLVQVNCQILTWFHAKYKNLFRLVNYVSNSWSSSLLKANYVNDSWSSNFHNLSTKMKLQTPRTIHGIQSDKCSSSNKIFLKFFHILTWDIFSIIVKKMTICQCQPHVFTVWEFAAQKNGRWYNSICVCSIFMLHTRDKLVTVTFLDT